MRLKAFLCSASIAVFFICLSYIIQFSIPLQAQSATPQPPQPIPTQNIDDVTIPLPSPLPPEVQQPVASPVLPTIPPLELEFVPSVTPTIPPTPEGGTIMLGQPINRVIEQNNAPATYELFAEAGDIISVRLTWQEQGLFMFSQFRREAQTGSILNQTATSDERFIGYFVVIPENGLYFVDVLNRSQQPITYELIVTRAPVIEADWDAPITGRLSETQDTLVYTLPAFEGELLRVEAASRDFNPYMILLLQGEGLPIRELTSRGITPTRQVIGPAILQETGRYLLVVRDMVGVQTGEFTLQAQQTRAPYTMTWDTSDAPYALAITEDQPRAYFTFMAAQGEIIDVSIQAEADDFDTRMVLSDRFGNAISADDDSGAGLNPELWALPLFFETAVYIVEVTSVIPGRTGAVNLTLRRNAETDLDRGSQIVVMSKGDRQVLGFQGMAGEVAQLNLTLLEGVNMPAIEIYSQGMILVNIPASSLRNLELGFEVPGDDRVTMQFYARGVAQEALVEVSLTRP